MSPSFFGILLNDLRQNCFIHNYNVEEAKKEQNASIIIIFIIQKVIKHQIVMVQSDVLEIYLRYNSHPFPYVLLAKFPNIFLAKVHMFLHFICSLAPSSKVELPSYLPISSHSGLWYHHVAICFFRIHERGSNNAQECNVCAYKKP